YEVGSFLKANLTVASTRYRVFLAKKSRRSIENLPPGSHLLPAHPGLYRSVQRKGSNETHFHQLPIGNDGNRVGEHWVKFHNLFSTECMATCESMVTWGYRFDGNVYQSLRSEEHTSELQS